MSTLVETEEDALSRALALEEVREVVTDLLPRAERIIEELKEGETRNCVLAFIMEGRRFLTDPEGVYRDQFQLNLGWIGQTLAPIVLRWEDIQRQRAQEAATSDFVGNVGQALFTEGEVTFYKHFPPDPNSDYPHDSYLTILKDNHGNVLKYWNGFNVVDPIESQAQGVEVKRHAHKGDKIRFKATVKEHQIYKGVKGTVFQRARKVELIHAAPKPEAAHEHA